MHTSQHKHYWLRLHSTDCHIQAGSENPAPLSSRWTNAQITKILSQRSKLGNSSMQTQEDEIPFIFFLVKITFKQTQKVNMPVKTLRAVWVSPDYRSSSGLDPLRPRVLRSHVVLSKWFWPTLIWQCDKSPILPIKKKEDSQIVMSFKTESTKLRSDLGHCTELSKLSRSEF